MWHNLTQAMKSQCYEPRGDVVSVYVTLVCVKPWDNSSEVRDTRCHCCLTVTTKQMLQTLLFRSVSKYESRGIHQLVNGWTITHASRCDKNKRSSAWMPTRVVKMSEVYYNSVFYLLNIPLIYCMLHVCPLTLKVFYFFNFTENFHCSLSEFKS